MRCSISEARAIQQDVQARVATGVEINQNSFAWHQNAVNRWHDTATEFSGHLPTHTIRVTPTPESRH
jgi:hypothetical protein